MYPSNPSTHRQPFSIRETGLVSLGLASIVTGLAAFLIRSLATNFDPRVGDSPIVRSAHVGGRLIVRLADVLLVAGALADGRHTP